MRSSPELGQGFTSMAIAHENLKRGRRFACIFLGTSSTFPVDIVPFFSLTPRPCIERLTALKINSSLPNSRLPLFPLLFHLERRPLKNRSTWVARMQSLQSSQADKVSTTLKNCFFPSSSSSLDEAAVVAKDPVSIVVIRPSGTCMRFVRAVCW